jgi:predicted DNA-binding transcriptional regulator YafY
VSRIESVGVRDERFVRPDGFDLAAHWAESSDSFELAMFRIEVRLRMRADAVGLLRHVLDPVSHRLVVVGPDDGDGWCLVTFPAESVDVVWRWLLFLGDTAEVLAPEEARQRVTAAAAGVGTLYDARSGANDIASTSRAATARNAST